MTKKSVPTVILAGAALVLAIALPGQDKPAAKPEPVTAFVGATLIDGTGAAPVPNAVVLIQGNRIKAAGPADKVALPVGAAKVDVRGKFLLPGFIHCHIHTGYPFSDLQYYTDTDNLATLRSLHIMDRYVRSGVTAVRDVGSSVPSMQALLAAQELGYIDSLRLFACGDLITVTGGHGDGLRGAMAVDGPWAWRKAVREMQKAGFKYIKVSPTFTPEEIQAAV